MRYIVICILIFIHSSCFSQNLVPDSSFEAYTNCPTSLSQVLCPIVNWNLQPTLISWYSPINTTSDYYNTCSTSPAATLPNNAWGYVPPHTGQGIVGIGPYSLIGPNYNTPQTSYREYVQCQLTQPMVAGQTYYVSCYVFFIPATAQLGTSTLMALDALAVSFTQSAVITMNGPLTLPFTLLQSQPQGFLANDTQWVRIYGQYVASGGEEYMTLGTFNNGQSPPMQTIVVPTNPTDTLSYYFIDDVSVRTTPPVTCDTVINTYDTTVCDIQPLLLSSATAATSYSWSTGQTTPAITVNAEGLYWRVATTGCDAQIDTFKVKFYNATYNQTHTAEVCARDNSVNISSTVGTATYLWSTGATSQGISVGQAGIYYCSAVENCNLHVDTFHVAPFQTYVRHTDTTVCFPATAVLAGEMNADAYEWSNGQVTETINMNEAGNYVCKAFKNCDVYIDSFTVSGFAEMDHIDLGNDRTICNEDILTLGREYTGSVNYLWNTGDTGCCIIPRNSGLYSIEINNGCNVISDSVALEVVPCEDCIFVPTAFTPNDDGKNDAFGVIAKCPLSSFSLKLFNRFGELVYVSDNITLKWNGLYKGQKADLGTYFYIIQYTSEGDLKDHLLKGDVILFY
jgi:gliding motility-associated-like protein